jgi:hypothetical protein
METRYSFVRQYLREFALAQAEWEYLDLCLHIAGGELPDVEYEELDRFRHRLEDIRLRTVFHHHDLTDAMLDNGTVDAGVLRWLSDMQHLLAQGAFDLHDRHGGQVGGLMATDFVGALEARADDYERVARDLLTRAKRFIAGDEPRRLRGIVAGPSIYGKGKGGKEPQGQGKPPPGSNA